MFTVYVVWSVNTGMSDKWGANSGIFSRHNVLSDIQRSIIMKDEEEAPKTVKGFFENRR
jgi:hypothetical protein